jgi:hypothetical protein
MGRPPLKNKQRQIAVALPPDYRERLEQAACAAQHSIAEEIRLRLERTFNSERLDPPTRDLLPAIPRLAELVRAQTGLDWHVHLEAWLVFRHAIDARLDRLRPPMTSRPSADRTSPLGPLVSPVGPLVSSENPETVGAGLEAIEFNSRPSADKRKSLIDQMLSDALTPHTPTTAWIGGKL